MLLILFYLSYVLVVVRRVPHGGTLGGEKGVAVRGVSSVTN